jgi:hypothetical protein
VWRRIDRDCHDDSHLGGCDDRFEHLDGYECRDFGSCGGTSVVLG